VGTRSNIGIENDDGTVDFIYCHWGGYPSNNGRILAENYIDPDKVRRLIALGDISSLGERIEPIGPHAFDKRESGTTVAYGRDRGETGIESRTATSIDGACQQVYAYVLRLDGAWWFCGLNRQWAVLAPGAWIDG